MCISLKKSDIDIHFPIEKLTAYIGYFRDENNIQDATASHISLYEGST